MGSEVGRLSLISQTVRPKVAHLRTFAEAATAVDTLLLEQSARGDVDESESEDEADIPGNRTVDEGEEEEEVSTLSQSPSGA